MLRGCVVRSPMDAIVHAALEEICSQGANGLTLCDLWSKIHSHLTSNSLHLCTKVKKAVWLSLVSIPGLRFEYNGIEYHSENHKIQSVEDSEAMDLKIIAGKDLFDCFLGIYDVKASDAGISEKQRLVLELLAIARTDGVTQYELDKEHNIGKNNIFYELKCLESRGLIVRQSAKTRKRKAGKEQTVKTNMIYLQRYAKHLCHCEPAVRDICDTLEKADGKVLVISDIKKELGYHKKPGHREWTHILKKLKDASLVEEFKITVNNKDAKCLRLLKKFSCETCMPRSHGGGDDNLHTEEDIGVKRGQITEQLLELPIKQQIYDMIDSEGSKGLISKEVCKRLGINKKLYHPKILGMVDRFGMHRESEGLDRNLVYRVWTSGNFNDFFLSPTPANMENPMDEKLSSHTQVGQRTVTHTIREEDDRNSKRDSRISNGETSVRIPDSGTASNSASRRRHSCLRSNLQRERRILEKLQEDKILLKPELHKLLNLENKQTKMDMRTLERSLNKLQKDEHCKCISFGAPSNCNHMNDVILHPSVYKAIDLADRIHEKLRSLDKQFETFDAVKIKGGKMVRAKLLHVFLWGYVTGLPGRDDAIHGYEQKNNPENSTGKLFELDAAIKSMPLELFSQVAGMSTSELESTVEKCRNGLCLSDLPIEEYTQATARLSYLINILINLKLIQWIVTDNPVGSFTTLRHSIELKPHIEEHVGGVNSVRHDFVLATRKDVDEYWNTLEHCNAASDPKAAFHGSAVHEVLHVFNDKGQKDKGAACVKEKASRSRKRNRSSKMNTEVENPLDDDDSDKKKHANLFRVEEQNSSQRCALSKLQSSCQKRFSWTQDKDRLLVIACVKHWVALGATFSSVDWSSLENLPGPPDTCRRRMSKMKRNKQFIKSVKRLYNMLSVRYAKHIENSKNKSLGRMIIHDHNAIDLNSDGRWDDFDNKDIKMVLDEVLQCKQQISKSEATKEARYVSKYPRSQSDVGAEYLDELKKDGGKWLASGQRSKRHLPVMLMKQVKDFDTQVYKSLEVSNAIELWKLIFLSTAKGPEVSNLLAKTSLRYSMHHLLTAFNYLRDKHFMVKGVLSRKFLQNMSSSPFPVNTGKRAVKMAKWLHERENELLDRGIDLFTDLQCGDVLQLCVLMCSGELSMSPCLPDEGIEEIKDSEANPDPDRKEKGFPGLRLSLSYSLLSKVDPVSLSRDESESGSGSNLEYNSSSSSQQHMEVISPSIGLSESKWEGMTWYGRHLASSSAQELSSFCPDLFETVYSAIQKAGDQGLSMEHVSQIIDVQGEKIPELIVEVLETFGCALKVNAYDAVHVVDSKYQSKYLLTSVASHQHDLDLNVPESYRNDGEPMELQKNNYEEMGKSLMKETSTDLIDVHTTTNGVHHRVTILNHLKEVSQSSCERNSEIEKCELQVGDYTSFKPILPWVNGDGTINEIVYIGLVRRVLGIVMQNPGILEENLISQMNALNPQSCRNLLELMILDGHIKARRLYQSTSNEPPAMLSRLFGCRSRKPKLVCREHLFANLKSICYL